MRFLIILVTLTGLAGLPSESSVRAEATPEQIRAATEAGKIKPLGDVLATVRREVPGKVLDVQVDDGRSPWLYRIKVRAKEGNVKLVTVNAATGRIMNVKGQR